MTADEYIQQVLNHHAVNVSGAEAAGNAIYPLIQRWAGGQLVRTEFSGSLRKGTAVSLTADADIFISLSSTTTTKLEQIYESLCAAVSAGGYPVRRQNVSVGTIVNGYKIDLVPGRRHSQNGNDHSLWKSRERTWTQTNIQMHINVVSSSNRQSEIRAIKIWRARNNLDFPSLYLELVVIEALRYARAGNIAANLVTVFQYLRDNFDRARFFDPANTNNVISDGTDLATKQSIARQASAALSMTWAQVIW